MAKTANGTAAPRPPVPDQPFLDTTAYGSGPDDSITDATEKAAITHHVAELNGTSIPYTARAGHLVTVDPSSSQPAAKFFYVAFTADGMEPTTRPVTFFYNGGPGSSSVFLLLGSFAPRRIRTKMPDFTPPPPYAMEDNPDSLLDRSDLVYIDPVGTGYSAAIAPFKNRDFWGVDQDAVSIKQFIKRYLSAFNRWNSPRFLFGESYGTARSCVLAWLLHEDGLDLNGITLQSSVLDYPANFSNAAGLMPTFAADAWYHKKTGIEPPAANLPSFIHCNRQSGECPRLLGRRYRLGSDGSGHHRRGGRRLRRLLDLLGLRRGKLEGGGTTGWRGLSRQAEHGGESCHEGRHDRLWRFGRQ